VATVQVTLTGAEMIKSLSAPSGPVKVISDSGDTRVVSFTTNDLSQPIMMNMRIEVPDQPAMPGGYKQDHSARAVFNTSGIPEAGSGTSTPSEASTGETTSGETVTPEENPPTGDNSQIMLYALLLVGSVGAIYAVRKLRPAGN